MKTPPTLGVVESTLRGFPIIYFKDKYGVSCSLQMSSLAEYEQPGVSAVWLGVVDTQPKVMAKEAYAVGVKTEETVGWVPFPIPDQVLISSRMHLDRNQVESLICHLSKWLKYGEF